MAIMSTGGNLPPERRTMTTGGNTPPELQPTSLSGLPTTSPIRMMDWQGTVRQGDENAMTRTVQGNELVRNQLNALTASDSQYIQQARDRAYNDASSRGMLFSSMAAGNAQRSAIDAALPIAQQDATTYGRTASENMAAVNQDRLADQGIWGQLTGQALGIHANLAESERARGFGARESALGRQFQSRENLLQRQHATGERLGSQDFQRNMQQMQNAWQGAQNNTQRTHELLTLERQQAHDAAMRELDRSFQGSQTDKQLLQQRFLEFENAMQNQGAMLAQVISSIYNNPNLSGAQQAAAVANARASFQSIFTSYASALSGGLPQIFWNPYQMQAPVQTGGNTPPGTTIPNTLTPPPGTTPPPGITPPPITNPDGGSGPIWREAFRRLGGGSAL